MTTDLDALIAGARELLAPGGYVPPRVNRLCGRLADALESTLAELRQERERADEAVERCMGHFVKHRNRAEAAEAALSRAEETIEKALGLLQSWPEQQVYKVRDVLTEYGKQKGTDRG